MEIIMFYKLKSSGKGFRLIEIVDKKGSSDDGFLYLTQDEIDLLNPKAIKGYFPVNKQLYNKTKTEYEMYHNLNKK